MKALDLSRLRVLRPGPGALVAAAFIGPGTIATCSVAGAGYGFALLWGLSFSIVATVILQEMAARLGVMSQMGLGEALRQNFHTFFGRALAAVLVISAIAIGNAAFEAGNITGARLGLESLGVATIIPGRAWVILTAAVTFIVLFTGNYRIIEKVLVGLVIIMSLTFLATAVFLKPDPVAVIKGMLIPVIPEGSLLTLVALIGTTVVPYNLFLYASAVKEHFRTPSELPGARTDLSVSVILGGFISMAIVISASSAFFGSGQTPRGGSDLALQLEPLLGTWSGWFIGTGLFAAGISSAITAPLAAAWAATGILGLDSNMRSWHFRIIWMLILATGTGFALTGISPMQIILFAQAANGILLPVIVIYLLKVMNNRKIMGENANGWISNLLGALVLLVVIVLSTRSLLLVFGVL